MSRVTLQKFKVNLLSEANDLEKLLDRGQNTPTNIQRLEQINTMLDVIAQVEKPNSIFKQALNL